VFLRNVDIGIKVSVRVCPGENIVQFVCEKKLSDLTVREARGVADALSRAAERAEYQDGEE